MQKTILAIMIIFIITLPLFFLSFSTGFVAVDESFYHKEFEELGVYEVFGDSVANLQASSIINFFKGKEVIHEGFFNNKEIQHLTDVKGLLDLNKKTSILLGIILLCCCLSVILLNGWKSFALMLRSSSWISGICLLLVGLVLFLGFSSMFVAFHELAFSNDLWKLNPLVDNLIVLFPEGFFIAALERIFFITLIGLLGVWVLGLAVEVVYQKFK